MLGNDKSFWDNEFLKQQHLEEDITLERVPEPVLREALSYISQTVELERRKKEKRNVDKFIHSIIFKIFIRIIVFIHLMLAYIEPPTELENPKMWFRISAAIESVILLYYVVVLVLRYVAVQKELFFANWWNRGSIISIVLCALGILACLSGVPLTFRPTRIFRVFFLADISAHTRRLAISILFTFGRMLRVVAVLWIFILLFTILGMIIMQYNVPGDIYFTDFLESLLSMIICLSTANFPDVMIPGYKYNRWIAVFFVSYISLCLFFGMNVILGFAYNEFQHNSTKVLVKKYMLQREKLLKAFYILDEAETRAIRTKFIAKRSFLQLITAGNPYIKDEITAEMDKVPGKTITILMYFKLCDKFIIQRYDQWNWRENSAIPKMVHQESNGNFYQEPVRSPLPEARNSIVPEDDEDLYQEDDSELVILEKKFKKFGREIKKRLIYKPAEIEKSVIYSMVHGTFHVDFPPLYRKFHALNRHWGVELVMVFALIGNGIITILTLDVKAITVGMTITIDTILYIFFCLVFIIKFLALNRFKRSWNRYEFLLLFVSGIGKVYEYVSLSALEHETINSLKVACLFRSLRLLLILSVVHKIRQMVKIVVRLVTFIGHYVVILFGVYYIFAQIGMALFYNKLVEGRPELIGSAYDAGDYYELVNFNNFPATMLTLFHLMVVNNWFVTMRATMLVTSKWACVYFIVFYQTIIIIFLNLVVAFIIESVIFHSNKSKSDSKNKTLHLAENEEDDLTDEAGSETPHELASQLQAELLDSRLESLTSTPEKPIRKFSSPEPNSVAMKEIKSPYN